MSAPRTDGIAGFNADPDQALARIEQWASAASAKADKYEEFARQAENLRLSASSRGGEVRVTVRSDGNLTDVEFSPRARTVPLPELSAMVLSTLRQAQAGIANQVGDVLAEQLGDQDPETRTLMVEELRSRFPGQEAEIAPPEPETPSPGEDGENSPW
ncbi:YbaB/EbfC family nucleoid-associated protein [Amycolatopsis decaplanina]|uniref:YbaB/EbfC DNA-binding family protein n=1 Tax=Amycolatopsis decaplanina DSM 44594 TaxID=1284240 RepID=M2YX72_9PSEU|nr:YbaB/EbfC family nucleoid-associated protein [Amycolatopsis decaplanina]EME52949.1 hypothetical protein H074_31552 [Amycolatopsis decaplanina DSM 44594]